MKPDNWTTERVSSHSADSAAASLATAELEPGIYAMIDALQDQINDINGRDSGSLILVPIAHAKGQIRVDVHAHFGFRSDPCMTHPAAVARSLAAGFRDIARHIERQGGVE